MIEKSGIMGPVLGLIVSGMVTGLTFAAADPAPPPYQVWQHSGSLYILTTPEGANLPASASENGFPLLVRLHKDFFDFSQARPKGEDIRFSTSTGDAPALPDRGVGCGERHGQHLGAHPDDQRECAAGDPAALGQGRCGERIQRSGGFQRLERIPERLAHE